MKEIVIDIAEDGEISLETKGFVGKACVEESQFLKDVLGKETFKRLTPEIGRAPCRERVYPCV